MLSLYCADDVIKLVTTTIIIVIIFLSDNYLHNEISLLAYRKVYLPVKRLDLHYKMDSLARVMFCLDDVIACVGSHCGYENWTHQSTAKQEFPQL